MSDEIHKHYHFFPDDPKGNWSVCSCFSVAFVCAAAVLIVRVLYGGPTPL